MERYTSEYNDLNRLVTVYGIGQTLDGKSLQDPAYKLDMLNDILAIMFYQRVVARFDTSFFGNYQPLMNDIIKSSTLLIMSHLNSQGWRAFMQRQLLQKLAVLLVAVLVYHVVFKPLILEQVKQYLPDWVKQDCIEDWAETLIILSFNNFDNLRNPRQLARTVALKMAGIVAYHYLIKPCK